MIPVSGDEYIRPIKRKVSNSELIEPLGATAWLHILDNTDGIVGNEPMKRLTFTPDNPFGIAGTDYSEEYTWTAIPLFTSP